MMEIPLLTYDSLDSTSTKALELLAQESSTPFAVTAKIQTAGRGQRNRPWSSPYGNLYLTFALPAALTGLKTRGLLPLKAATLVAQWLQTSFGLRVSLKWPNDL